MGNRSSTSSVDLKRKGKERGSSFIQNSTYQSVAIFTKDGVFPISRVRKNIHPPDKLMKSNKNNLCAEKIGRLYLCQKENGLSINTKATHHFSLVLDVGGHSDGNNLRGICMHIAFSPKDKNMIYIQQPIDALKDYDFNSVTDTGGLVYPHDNIEHLKRLSTGHPEFSEMDMSADKNDLWYYYIVFQMDDWLSEFVETYGRTFSANCNCQSFAKFLHKKLSGVEFPNTPIFGQSSFDKFTYSAYSTITQTFKN
ncbi:hypothetical protein CYY_002935 [Polysphondylium violaceum]|uniref:Uncharacterized protein n=1 Tax=Polysphondylium violaceum TaxID=133409 RepID=A0A8J4PVJ0_9MYCE|nr:hypothetical protein CYY_002935 [Polysphondylium violaceum]